MRKSLLLLVIGLTSLVIMACGMVGFAQIETEQPQVESSNEAKPEKSEPEAEAGSQSQVQQPTPDPTIDPIISAKSCLAKTWEIPDLSDYVIAAVPPEMVAEYNLKYEETTGSAYLKLTPDGQITLLANDLQLVFSAQAFVFSVPVIVRLNGTATGDYTVDSTTLTITNVDTSGLSASAQAMGEDVIEPAQILRSIPFVSPPYNTAQYSCQGDTLTLALSGYSGDIPPLVFRAVE
jgi:hypothetical protein